MPKKIPKTLTLESGAFLDGLFMDFTEQIKRYQHLTTHRMQIEAQLELAEKTLCLTRDHLKMTLDNTEGSQNRLPQWQQQATRVRFVGVRLVDACAVVLKDHRKLTPQKLLDAINEGTFRFRTNAPLREIHAALLRHPYVKREGNYYVWNAPKEEQIAMHVRGKRTPTLVAEDESETGSEVKPN